MKSLISYASALMLEKNLHEITDGYLNKPFEVEDVAALLGVDLISAR